MYQKYFQKQINLLIRQRKIHTLILFLATVTKAITFGGFLGDITDGLQVTFRSNISREINISDPGRARVLPGSSPGWGCILSVCWPAPHCSRLHRPRPHLREDLDGLLPLLRDDLPHNQALDWSLVCSVLYHHCCCRWLRHRKVLKLYF